MFNKTSKYYNDVLKELFEHVLREYNINLNDTILCRPKSGVDLRLPSDEYALLRGPEILLTCEYRDGIGQVFATAPRSFKGSLRDVLSLNLNYIRNASIFHAVMNAVLKHLGLIDKSEHCSGEKPKLCGYALYIELLSKYGQDFKVLHVGYQPSHIEYLSKLLHDNLVVTDLDERLVWSIKYGRPVIDGLLNKYLIHHADIVLLTASSIVNNTAWEVLNHAYMLRKEIVIYGVSASAAIYLLNNSGILKVKHFCPYAK